MKPLRIAMFVTNRFTLTEQTATFAPIWLHNDIALGLHQRGHQVTLFASKDSRLGALTVAPGGLLSLQKRKLPLNPHQLPTDQQVTRAKMNSFYEQVGLSRMYAQAQKGKFDILHVHPVDVALPLSRLVPQVPTLVTLHDELVYWRKFLYKLYQADRQVYYVSISHAQRRPLPNLNYIATIHHGVNLEKFKFSAKPKNFFIHVARIIPEKGTHLAALAARQTGLRLKIAGQISQAQYFEKKVKPLLNARVQYIGFKQPRFVQSLFESAKGLVLPLQWEEPFGLVMIEAMASGTPVIAYPRGAAPEIIRDGKNGFLPKNFGQLKNAMRQIEHLDRQLCRASVEQHFSIQRMVDDYEQAYIQVIKHHKHHASLS